MTPEVKCVGEWRHTYIGNVVCPQVQTHRGSEKLLYVMVACYVCLSGGALFVCIELWIVEGIWTRSVSVGHVRYYCYTYVSLYPSKNGFRRSSTLGCVSIGMWVVGMYPSLVSVTHLLCQHKLICIGERLYIMHHSLPGCVATCTVSVTLSCSQLELDLTWMCQWRLEASGRYLSCDIRKLSSHLVIAPY